MPQLRGCATPLQLYVQQGDPLSGNLGMLAFGLIRLNCRPLEVVGCAASGRMSSRNRREIKMADVGKTIETDKKRASLRQICAAIDHFHKGNYECAITLAAAGEGCVPEGVGRYLFR